MPVYEEQMDLIALMNETLGQIETITTQRAAFCKRYRDYTTTCTAEEYKELRSSFLPKIKIAENSLIDPVFEKYSTQTTFVDFFNQALSNYTKLIIQCKHIRQGLAKVKTDADLDLLKRDVDKMFHFLTEWDTEYGLFFKHFYDNFRRFLTSLNVSYSIRAIDPMVNEFKGYAFPEIGFVTIMLTTLNSITTDAALPTTRTLAEIDEITNSASTEPQKRKKIIDIVSKVQIELEHTIAAVHKDLENLKAKDPDGNLLTQRRYTAIKSDLDSARSLLERSLVKELEKTNKQTNQWFDFVYELNSIMRYCNDIQLELSDIEESLPKDKRTARKSVSSSSQSKQQVIEEEEEAGLTKAMTKLHLKATTEDLTEQEQAEYIESLKAAAIQEQNKALAEARKKQREDQRPAKQVLYQHQQDRARKASSFTGEEEEVAGSTLKFALNNKNYDTLLAIFAEEHNTITYAQVVNLIESETIGGKISSGGGSNRKITIRGIDMHTFEPSDSAISGGFHAKHKSGHNDKTLIKPIVQDLKVIFEKAGFTPSTCVAKKDATPLSTPTTTPESSPRDPKAKKRPA